MSNSAVHSRRELSVVVLSRREHIAPERSGHILHSPLISFVSALLGAHAPGASSLGVVRHEVHLSLSRPT